MAEALCHNFHEIVATHRMKDSLEPCSLQMKAHKFEFMQLVDTKMKDCVCTKCGKILNVDNVEGHKQSELLKATPDTNAEDSCNHTHGRIAADETELKKAFVELSMPHEHQFLTGMLWPLIQNLQKDLDQATGS